MVQLDVDAIAAPLISMAWDLAQRHEADLIGFCAADAGEKPCLGRTIQGFDPAQCSWLSAA
ncbi:hypothetical protein [Mesorhizobium sp. B2-6-4]|uniref:hypothetical protein n=1 Tax=Mesorhizobium sp. B2-6-4 TaxID=2589913 RepID=UPI00112B790F|nr:hypothetical protein [Mesorhizobium sp. B2-6-4]TPJ54753.1 hypothetical protein FJ426_07135 [Mesorhizobium sp. B2-6-4]